MQHGKIAVLLGAAILAGSLSIDDANAQGRGGSGQGRGQDQSQGQGPGRGQSQSQGQQQGRGGGAQQGQQSRSGVATQQQAEIRERIRTRDIYGRDLMSAEERRRYQDRVNAATSDRQWAEIREQHMNEMRQRAQSQGRPLDPPVYGQHMMTRQERNEYQNRLEAAQSEAERTRIRNEHQATIRERAQLLGVDPPAAN